MFDIVDLYHMQPAGTLFYEIMETFDTVVKFSRNRPECRSSTSGWHSTTSNWHFCTLEGHSCSISQSFSLPEWQCLKFVHVHVLVQSKHLNETIGSMPQHRYRMFTSMIAELPLPVYVFLSLSRIATLHVCCNFSRFIVPQFHHLLWSLSLIHISEPTRPY